MDKRDYELLLALDQHKNITKAAQSLYMTQPAITKRIQKMEEELHCPLLIRSKRGVLLTPAAESLLPCARTILKNMEQMEKNQDQEFLCLDESGVEAVRQQMPDEDDLYDLAELYKVFGDSTRIRILFVLFEAEVCVCDLAKALNMTQSAISHQLRILKQNKLVKSRRDGKSIFYSLADEHVRTIIDQGREHIEED